MASSQPEDQHPPVAAASAVAVGVGGLLAVDLVRRLYLVAETRALHGLRKAVAHVLRAPLSDDTARFDAGNRLHRDTVRMVNQLTAEAGPVIHRVVADAHDAGARAAEHDLGLPPDAPTPFPVDPLADVHRELEQIVTSHQRVVQVVDERYRQIVDKAIAAETGRVNRQRVAQRALDEFASRGVSVFQDRAGRQWSIDAYVEMSVRTIAATAQRDAYLARAMAAGVTKFRVSHSPTCCPLCAPYDGQLLTAEELAAATGLFHPNCRHTVTAVRAIDKVLPTPRPDMDRYEAEQRLRYLERRVRAARRREAVALDPAALRKARAELRAAWAAIRAHIDETDIPRQRQREQIIRARG